VSTETWTRTTLGEFFRLKHGFAFKGEFFANSGPYILLTPGNFRADGGLEARGDREKYYVGDFPKEFLLNEGEVLVVLTDLTQDAPILGSPAIIPAGRKYLHNQRLGKVVGLDESKLKKKFLYYLLNTANVREQIKATATGSTVRHTAPDRIYTVRVTLPEPLHQQRIADVLSAYDDLIQSNSRRIKVLKAMAKIIFDGASQSSSEPWTQLPISELYEELFDGPHATPRPSTSGPIYLGIKNVTEQGELDLTDIRHIAEEDYPKWTRRVVPQSGDIVFTYEATLNRYGIIGEDFCGCLGRRMALIRPDKSKIDSYLLLQCLLSNQWRDEVRSKTISGATVDRIPLTTFPSFQISVPGPEARRRIAPAIRACEEMAENCRRRNDVLRKTRDFLLHKLVSGEVSVENLEEEVLAETV
jgi:type I restriction enzyme S subunit